MMLQQRQMLSCTNLILITDTYEGRKSGIASLISTRGIGRAFIATQKSHLCGRVLTLTNEGYAGIRARLLLDTDHH